MPDHTPSLTPDDLATGERLRAEHERLCIEGRCDSRGWAARKAAHDAWHGWLHSRAAALLTLAREALLARVGSGRREE